MQYAQSHACLKLGAASALWAKGLGHLRPLAFTALHTHGCSLASLRLQAWSWA